MSQSKKLNFIPERKVRYNYVPVQETLTTDDGESYVTYGISVRAVEEEIGKISDVSTEYQKVRRLADLCTEQELSPEHLDDVVEDFLADEDAVLM